MLFRSASDYGNGGAVYIYANSGEISFTNCSFDSNEAHTNKTSFDNDHAAGGAIYINAADSSYSGSSVIFDTCQFTNNVSQGHGGAIMQRLPYNYPAILKDCTFYENRIDTSSINYKGSAIAYFNTSAYPVYFSGAVTWGDGQNIYIPSTGGNAKVGVASALTVKDTTYDATVIPIVFDSVSVGNTIITNSSTSTATLADEVGNFSAEKSDGTTYSIDTDGKIAL